MRYFFFICFYYFYRNTFKNITKIDLMRMKWSYSIWFKVEPAGKYTKQVQRIWDKRAKDIQTNHRKISKKNLDHPHQGQQDGSCQSAQFHILVISYLGKHFQRILIKLRTAYDRNDAFLICGSLKNP